MIKEVDFLKQGFVKEEQDLMFKYRKELISEEQIIENDLDEKDVPALLFGTTGINSGFCIYTGEHFVWLNVETPREAVAIAEIITAFEPV